MSDAATWVGPSDPQKDKLDLQYILAALPKPEHEAAELKTMLRDPQVTGPFEDRRRCSQEAAGAQRAFNRLGLTVVACSAVAALASGLLLYGAGAGEATSPPDQVEPLVEWARQNRTVIIAVQVISLFAASVAGAMLTTRNYGRRWTEARRKSETERIGLFEAMIDLAAQVPNQGPAGALRQAFEFFRRYQLELQFNFYTRRGNEHDVRDARIVWAASILGGIAAVTGAIGAIGGSFAVAAAFFGIAVPILLSATQSWRNVNRAAETAASYKAAAEALGKLKRGMTAVRAQADLGDVPAVTDFVARVHEVMRVENGTWVGGGQVHGVPSGAAAPGEPVDRRPPAVQELEAKSPDRP